MWAVGKNGLVRHDYGSQELAPLAICGWKGEHPLDYNAVKIPKCLKCLSLWPTYNKEKGKKK